MNRYLLLIGAGLFFGAVVQFAQAESFEVTKDSKGVRFETQGIVATADRVEYDTRSDKLVLEGKRDMPVRLIRAAGGHTSDLRARRVTLYVNSGKLHVEGIQFLNAKP